MTPVRFADLFCGIGGFRIAIDNAAASLGRVSSCVFSSDIDDDARASYAANFGEQPTGDITEVDADDIPDHDLLLAGFPCQSFSIMGKGLGFNDTRGTLFFDVARILDAKRPPAFVLENVKRLHRHDGGRTLSTILSVLDGLGYRTEHRILNALDFGLPQSRERIVLVGFADDRMDNFRWPSGGSGTVLSLDDILEPNDGVDARYFASERIVASRRRSVQGKDVPDGRTIWHENRSGNVSALPWSCALRASASYNYLLVDGVRRPTEREMLRLQGFPERFVIACNYAATRKQAGNSVPVPMIEAVVRNVLLALSPSAG